VQVQSASAYSALSLLNIPSRQKQASASAATASSIASAATSADRTTISQAARDLLAAQSRSAAPAGSGATAVFDTNQGSMTLDVDDYFTPKTTTSGSPFSLPPLLLPTQKNIEALTDHISATFPRFLAQNNIPYAPSSITYDREGKVQLPPDYPYASEFKQALANNPTMARELSTVNALTSHWVEMKKSMPFQQEYAAATTQAEVDAVVAKYRYLFSGNRHYDTIALQFSASGSLTLTADGKPLS
jgi:hypothetical protein